MKSRLQTELKDSRGLLMDLTKQVCENNIDKDILVENKNNSLLVENNDKRRNHSSGTQQRSNTIDLTNIFNNEQEKERWLIPKRPAKSINKINGQSSKGLTITNKCKELYITSNEDENEVVVQNNDESCTWGKL